MERIKQFKQSVKAFAASIAFRNAQSTAELLMQHWIKQIERINVQHTPDRAYKDFQSFVKHFLENKDVIEELQHNNLYKSLINFILSYDFAEEGGVGITHKFGVMEGYKGLDMTYEFSQEAQVQTVTCFCKVRAKGDWLVKIVENCGVYFDVPALCIQERQPVQSLEEVLKFIAKTEQAWNAKKQSIYQAVVKQKNACVARMKTLGFTDAEIELVKSFW